MVSDDGSTDGTVGILRALGDPRIRILEDNANHGPLGNFEHAIRHARGDTIVLSDQDDVWLDNKLPLVRELFAGERARPFLVVLDAEVVDDVERPVEPSVLARLDAGPGLAKNLWTNRYLGCCIAFSRDLLDVALPFPRGVEMHDIWLGQLCERIGSTRFVPVVTMRYRRHGETVTGFEVRFQPLQQIRRRVRWPGTLRAAPPGPAGSDGGRAEHGALHYRGCSPSRRRAPSRPPATTARSAPTRCRDSSACAAWAATDSARRNRRPRRTQRCMPLGDHDQVPRVVVQRGRGRRAARGGRHLMTHDARRDDDDREAEGAGAERPVHVLAVREQVLVERADGLDRLAGHQHRTAARNVDRYGGRDGGSGADPKPMFRP